MKNFLSFLLVLVLVFSLCACNGSKAEKYCSECGKGIKKNVAFCEHCGASLKSNNESSNTSSTQSQKQETSEAKPVVASKPTTTQTTSSKPAPVHTHSYSKKVTAATCTQQGYTTYTCSCGHSYKDSYTNLGSHSYSKYVCTNCGVVEKSHAYEYLIEWVKANGTQDDNSFYYVFEGKNNKINNHQLLYWPEDNSLSVWRVDARNKQAIYSSVYLNDYFYGFTFGDDKIYGYLNATTYTENTNLTYTSSDCSILEPSEYLAVAKSTIDLILICFESFLINDNLGVSLADLGFKSF